MIESEKVSESNWTTLSFEEALPFIDGRFHGIMKTRKQWADEAGKEIVFQKKDNEVFYRYEDKEVKNEKSID